MPTLEVRPLAAGDLAACGRLLARRHRRHRLAQPLLSARFEDAGAATAAVTEAFGEPDASGAVAVRGGEPVGFLLGAPKRSAAWGPNVWVEAAGQAVTEPEAVRDLYAVAAARWVGEGRTAHYVLVPAHDDALVRAWFRLGFGQQQAHAIRPATGAGDPDPGVRRAVRADIPALAELDVEIPRHQQLAPTFSAQRPGTVEVSRQEWDEDFDDPEYATFVVERGGAVVGFAVGCALEKAGAHRGPARPDNAGYLSLAAVLPHARGTGAGRAVGEAVVDWSGRAGFDSVVTDWRVTNLLSSRTWPALGFRETFLRLHRLVGY